MTYLNHLLFGIYPYIALAVFVVGSLIRYDREQYTWKTGSSQILESKKLRQGSVPFHVGVIMILAGHFVGLLTPVEIWHLLGIEAAAKQMIAVVLGGVAGVICFYGLTILVMRRLFDDRIRASSVFMDTLIVLLIYVQLILGMISILFTMKHMDGSEMLKMMAWAQNIVTLDGTVAAESIKDIGLIYKLHILLGMTLFLLFPFSRLVHIASVPVKYFLRSYQIVRQK